MKFLNYIKDKKTSILIFISNLILTIFILLAFKSQIELIITITILIIILGINLITINYFKKKIFYDNLLNNLSKLDKKYLILETIPSPITYEEKIMCDILYDINKSMIENINNFQNNITDFKEFVELWIHEVKIPISSLILKCHNNQDKYNKDLIEQVNRLDNYIDQILYYVRSENTEKDFIINKVLLSNIVKNVNLKNKNDLLDNNINLKVSNVNYEIYTDGKWLEFILNQIINNSIKYKKEVNSVIEINAFQENKNIVLSIFDNGIGIPKQDINNVFEKSFTGINGKYKVKSTGMGLYISKNLCNKLGHDIYIESVYGEYTKVSITFFSNDFYNV